MTIIDQHHDISVCSEAVRHWRDRQLSIASRFFRASPSWAWTGKYRTLIAATSFYSTAPATGEAVPVSEVLAIPACGDVHLNDVRRALRAASRGSGVPSILIVDRDNQLLQVVLRRPLVERLGALINDEPFWITEQKWRDNLPLEIADTLSDEAEAPDTLLCSMLIGQDRPIRCSRP